MAAQPETRQIEADPLERLRKVTPEGLLAKGAVARHIGKVDPPSHRTYGPKQLLQKGSPPDANLAIVNVAHFTEDGRKRRRQQRVRKHRSWGLFAGYKQTYGLLLFYANLSQTCTECCLTTLKALLIAPHPRTRARSDQPRSHVRWKQIR